MDTHHTVTTILYCYVCFSYAEIPILTNTKGEENSMHRKFHKDRMACNM